MDPARGGNRSGGRSGKHRGGGGGGGRSGRYGGRGYSSRGRSSHFLYREVVRSNHAVSQPDDVSPISGPSAAVTGSSATSSVDGFKETFNDKSSLDESPIYSELNVETVQMLRSPDQGEEHRTLSCNRSSRISGNCRGGGGRSFRDGGRGYSSRGRSSQRVYREVVRSNHAVSQPDDVSPINGPSAAVTGNSATSSVDGFKEMFNDKSSLDESPIYPELNAETDQMLRSPDQGEEHQTLSCFQDSQTPLESESQRGKSNAEEMGKEVDSEKSESRDNGFSFDICVERNTATPKLNQSLLEKNREAKRRAQGVIKILRPGMILLKGYISLKDQVKLIKACRDLGCGRGGFYQPGYRDGAKLNLKMMCLGKNWDPETSMYGDKRPADDAKPPPIPFEFHQMVERAIQDCHSYLETQSNKVNVREIIPSMSPNLCIVNFYSKTGKLGLHQDKDESRESLRKGLPVVSFSLGDTAEFLYGDQRDIDGANKVELQSGDVLIFGGMSRHIYHGVHNIIPGTAPKALLEVSNLRPGRLNLTFREY